MFVVRRASSSPLRSPKEMLLLSGIVVAQCWVCHGVRVHAANLVFRGDSLGRVSSCCMEDACLVQEMALVQQLACARAQPLYSLASRRCCACIGSTKSVGNTTVIRV